MLEMLDTDIDNCVAFQISGKITEDDMNRVLSRTRETLDQHDDLVILEKIDSFEGVEMAALREEFKYLFDVGFSNIRKAAVVTDKDWLKHIVSIEDKIFRSMDIRSFPIDDMDAAIEFLKT